MECVGEDIIFVRGMIHTLSAVFDIIRWKSRFGSLLLSGNVTVDAASASNIFTLT